MNTQVSFEIAKLLKEKGYNVGCFYFYEHALTSQIDPETGNNTGAFGWEKGETNLANHYFINNHPDIDFSSENWFMCAAPTIAEVVMWLHGKHGIWIEVRKSYLGGFVPVVKDPRKELDKFNSPTEAYEAAITYILKKLKL